MARLSFLSPFVELTNEENVEADRNILGRLERRGEVKIFHDLDLLAIVCDGGCHIDQYNDQCTLPLCHLASHTWIVNVCSSSHLNCCLQHCKKFYFSENHPLGSTILHHTTAHDMIFFKKIILKYFHGEK